MPLAMAERIAHLLGPGYTVGDWTQTNVGLFSGLKLETFTHFLVLLLIVLVAAFNIVATLVMVVMERRKEVAILQAMGAPANSVAAIFLFEGALLGVVGTIAGVGAGFVTSYLIGKYHLIHLPPDVFMVSAVPARLYPAISCWSRFRRSPCASVPLSIPPGKPARWRRWRSFAMNERRGQEDARHRPCC